MSDQISTFIDTTGEMLDGYVDEPRACTNDSRSAPNAPELFVTAFRRLLLAAVLQAAAFPISAQQLDSTTFASMRWRMIGPHRGGLTVGAVGVAGQPNLFYIG